MNLSELFEAIDIREVGAPIAMASNTDSNSDRIDMAGFEGALFITPVTDCANTGVATQKIEQNTADSDTGMAALASTTATGTSAADDDMNNKLLVSGVFQPRERYIQAVRTSTVANIAFGTQFVILFGVRKQPVTDHSTIISSAFAYSPAEA